MSDNVSGLTLHENDLVRVTVVGRVTSDKGVRLEVVDPGDSGDSTVGLAWLALVGAEVRLLEPARGTRPVCEYRQGTNPQGSNVV